MDLTVDKAVWISRASELSMLQLLKELEGGIYSGGASSLMRHVDASRNKVKVARVSLQINGLFVQINDLFETVQGVEDIIQIEDAPRLEGIV